MLSHLNAIEMQFPSVDEYEQMLGVQMTPSRHSTAIFLVSFWKKGKQYMNEMIEKTVDKDDGWLSCNTHLLQ